MHDGRSARARRREASRREHAGHVRGHALPEDDLAQQGRRAPREREAVAVPAGADPLSVVAWQRADQRKPVASFSLSQPVEIGRQDMAKGEPAPLPEKGEHVARVDLPDRMRLIIAGALEKQVSRQHLRLEPQPGDKVTAGSPCGELESTKSVSEIYAPVSGEIVAVNSAIETAPELVNAEPYAGGWMFEVKPDDPAAVGELLSAAEYAAGIE